MQRLDQVPLVWQRQSGVYARLQGSGLVIFLGLRWHAHAHRYRGSSVGGNATDHRRAAATDAERIAQVVDRAASRHPEPRRGRGKKVLRRQPDIEWDKGHAVLWLLERLGLDRPGILPICLGDDLSDEDALRAVRRRGAGIVGRGEDDARDTAAKICARGPR